ncbi:MAG: hypothetical protein E6Q97_01330 [Desulfurellales bacterium]|nr:MAG: hypothetical protein E6Q97_01330 [Desulfurellales bacterium]
MTLDELVTAMAVDRVACFAAQLEVQADGTSKFTTQCSAYAYLVCAVRGVPMLVATANKQHDWLMKEGRAVGWTPINRDAAARFAEREECTVVASAKAAVNGHIAVCVPVPAGEKGLWVSSAGRNCFVRAPIERSFGASLVPSYFVFTKEMRS